MLGKSVGDDLVGDIIELDLEVLGNGAGKMDREEEIQIKGRVQRSVDIISRAG